MPSRPVPIVKALVAVAVIVPEAPRATVWPLKVTDELVRATFGMLLKVFAEPLIDFPVSVPGMSASTKRRNDVAAEPPDVGPAYT